MGSRMMGIRERDSLESKGRNKEEIRYFGKEIAGCCQGGGRMTLLALIVKLFTRERWSYRVDVNF